MADPASYRTVVFHESTVALTFWSLFGAAITVQGVLTAGYFVLFDERGPPGLTAVGAGLGCFLALFGCYFCWYAFGRMRDQHPPITIGPGGLHDRAVSERPIPWADVRDIRVVRARGRYVAFDIAEGAVEKSGVWPFRRLEARANRALGYPGYQVHRMGTAAEVETIVKAVRPHAPVAGLD